MRRRSREPHRRAKWIALYLVLAFGPLALLVFASGGLPRHVLDHLVVFGVPYGLVFPLPSLVVFLRGAASNVGVWTEAVALALVVAIALGPFVWFAAQYSGGMSGTGTSDSGGWIVVTIVAAIVLALWYVVCATLVRALARRQSARQRQPAR